MGDTAVSIQTSRQPMGAFSSSLPCLSLSSLALGSVPWIGSKASYHILYTEALPWISGLSLVGNNPSEDAKTGPYLQPHFGYLQVPANREKIPRVGDVNWLSAHCSALLAFEVWSSLSISTCFPTSDPLKIFPPIKFTLSHHGNSLCLF